MIDSLKTIATHSLPASLQLSIESFCIHTSKAGYVASGRDGHSQESPQQCICGAQTSKLDLELKLFGIGIGIFDDPEKTSVKW